MSFDCFKQSLKWLKHKSTHPPTHPPTRPPPICLPPPQLRIIMFRPESNSPRFYNFCVRQFMQLFLFFGLFIYSFLILTVSRHFIMS